jgi:hypothetical protein
MTRSILFAAMAALALGIGGGHAQRAPELSDAQVRQEIIKESIASYKANGRPCACPFDRMRNGRECSDRSAYSRPGGASPLCYPKDVGDTMVQSWRRRH